jgi:hypothetical protein
MPSNSKLASNQQRFEEDGKEVDCERVERVEIWCCEGKQTAESHQRGEILHFRLGGQLPCTGFLW